MNNEEVKDTSKSGIINKLEFLQGEAESHRIWLINNISHHRTAMAVLQKELEQLEKAFGMAEKND